MESLSTWLICSEWTLPCVRECSHDPGLVGYAGVLIAPGQVLASVHIFPGATLLHCPRASSSLLWIDVTLFSFATNLLQRTNFTKVWPFLALSRILFIVRFGMKFSTEHAWNNFCPRATFAFCSHGGKLTRQGIERQLPISQSWPEEPANSCEQWQMSVRRPRQC